MLPEQRRDRTRTDPNISPRRLMTRIGYLLNRPALQIRHMAAEALRPMGLVPPHVAILSTLRTDGPQTQRALGDTLRIDPTTMVWLIDSLEKKGLVRRGKHPKDRRAHLVELSPSGKSLYERAAKRFDQLEEQFLEPLSKTERDDLRRLLAKLFRNVTPTHIPPKLFGKQDNEAL